MTPQVVDQLRSVAFLLTTIADAMQKAITDGPLSCDGCKQRVQIGPEMRVYHAACDPGAATR